MEWSRRVEYHIFLIYQKLTVQDFNFQLFGILRGSTLRFDGSPLLYLISYSNLSGRGVTHKVCRYFIDLCGKKRDKKECFVSEQDKRDSLLKVLVLEKPANMAAVNHNKRHFLLYG